MGLAAVVVVVCVGLSPQLFAVAQDQEFARVAGLNVRFYNLLVAVLAAVSVTVAMRTVGLLLVSALMVVPVATVAAAHPLLPHHADRGDAARHARVAGWAAALGVRVRARDASLRVRRSCWWPWPASCWRGRSASTCATGAACSGPSPWCTAAVHEVIDEHPHEHGKDCGHVAVEHGDHVDYVHGGHRHAVHGKHYDEH